MPLVGRKPDEPGTYRIKLQPSGAFLLSGVSKSGKRLKFPGLSYGDAERTALEVFGAPPGVPTTPLVVGPASTKVIEDWGLPIGVSVDTAAQVNSSLGVPTVPVSGTALIPTIAPIVSEDETAKKVKRAKQAKSLMELAGVSWAAGSVWVGRRMTDAADKDPVSPNPRQVNDLAEVTRETLTEWFGDREVKPWQMMFLLTLGIPLSIFIQSPRRKKEKVADLKSVP